MNKSLRFFIVFVCFVFCTSCSICNESKSNDTGLLDTKHTSEFDFPYLVNSKLEFDVLPIHNTKEWEQWSVISVNGEDVLKRSENFGPAPPGIRPPALRIGNDDWKDYSVSFDFYLGTSEQVSFVLYDNSNTICPENSYFDGEQRFWFALHSDGKVSFETTSGVDSFYLTNDANEYLQIEGFDPDLWNTIIVRNVENNLKLFVNNVEIAIICQINGDEYGRLALGGSVGCMFKNLSIE